jgi:LysM repeat protein
MSMVPPDTETARVAADRADAVAGSTIPRGCPFLLAHGGGWRLDLPTREHRCGAVSPPAPLSPEKQTRLCLTQAHASCATYLASMAAREERLGTPPSDRATRWGLARTTTVIEDAGGLRARVLASLLDRRKWPAIPAVLLVTTLFTLALSGFRGGDSNTAAATASPTGSAGLPVATQRPSVRPSTPEPEPDPTSTAPATATTAPTPVPTATPGPAESFRTYRVQSGDTLSAIAADFGTTSRAIADLNGISVGSTLRIGQVLKIPN